MSLLVNVVVPSVYAWVSEKNRTWSIQNGLVRLHEEFTLRCIWKCVLYDSLWQDIHIAALSVAPNLFTVDDQLVLYSFFLLIENMKTTIRPHLTGFFCMLWKEIHQISDLSGSVTTWFWGDVPLAAVISSFPILVESDLNHSTTFCSCNWNGLFA